MKRQLPTLAAALLLLAGCSTPSTEASSTGAPSSVGPSAATAPAGGSACSAGLKGTEPGVVRITCDGPAEIKIRAGDVSRDLHGGRCQSIDGQWSATIGVEINDSGLLDPYTGPPVEMVRVNEADIAGLAAIQAVIGGKHYYDIGTATLTLSLDNRTAHIEGTSDQTSDAPGARLVVDVAC